MQIIIRREHYKLKLKKKNRASFNTQIFFFGFIICWLIKIGCSFFFVFKILPFLLPNFFFFFGLFIVSFLFPHVKTTLEAKAHTLGKHLLGHSNTVHVYKLGLGGIENDTTIHRPL